MAVQTNLTVHLLMKDEHLAALEPLGVSAQFNCGDADGKTLCITARAGPYRQKGASTCYNPV
jgi:hypothetical protein